MNTRLPPRPVAAPGVFRFRTILAIRTLQILLLASAVIWLYGCGVQGTPHPPRLERPARIANLTATQIGQSVELHFGLPQQTTDGERLTKPMEVEILRAVAPEGTGLSKLPEPTVWISLTHDEWSPHAHDGAIAYSAHLTQPEYHDWRGRTLVVGVRTLTRGFRHRAIESEISNLVGVPVLDVSEPPGGVKSVVHENAVEIEFVSPATSIGGEPIHDLSGFRIYRSLTGLPDSFEMIGETPTPPFQDTHFEFGQTYFYQVRAVFGKSGPVAMSDASQTLQVVPRDVFAPAPPQGLSSIYTAGAVELVWSANTEADLAGYNVYRMENQTAQRVNKELVPTPIFRDTTSEPEKTLTYYVTAVDRSGNESKPSQHEVIETK